MHDRSASCDCERSGKHKGRHVSKRFIEKFYGAKLLLPEKMKILRLVHSWQVVWKDLHASKNVFGKMSGTC